MSANEIQRLNDAARILMDQKIARLTKERDEARRLFANLSLPDRVLASTVGDLQNATVRAETAEAALRELVEAYDAWDLLNDSPRSVDTYFGDKVNARCDTAEADARVVLARLDRAVGERGASNANQKNG